MFHTHNVLSKMFSMFLALYLSISVYLYIYMHMCICALYIVHCTYDVCACAMCICLHILYMYAILSTCNVYVHCKRFLTMDFCLFALQIKMMRRKAHTKTLVHCKISYMWFLFSWIFPFSLNLDLNLINFERFVEFSISIIKAMWMRYTEKEFRVWGQRLFAYKMTSCHSIE